MGGGYRVKGKGEKKGVLSGCPVRLEGDSILALTWAEKGTTREIGAHNASMVSHWLRSGRDF